MMGADGLEPPGSNSYCTAVELPTDGGGRLGTPRRWPHNLPRRTVATGAMLDQFRPDVQGNSPFIVGVSGHRDLDPAELPRLKEAVAAFVTQLKSYLPDTASLRRGSSAGSRSQIGRAHV